MARKRKKQDREAEPPHGTPDGGDEPDLGSSRAEDAQGGSLDDDSRGIGGLAMGQTEARAGGAGVALEGAARIGRVGQDVERPEDDRATTVDEDELTPAGTPPGRGRGEER